MYAWSVKRRLIYGGGLLLVLLLVTGLFYTQFLYKAPTCSDGLKNGDEKGIDCGGSCKNLCTLDTLAPVVLWSKIFNISGDVYTVVAYVQNPNITSHNPKAKYKFRILDQENNLILDKIGETSIPKNKKFAVFETNIVISGRKPKSVDFEFTNFSVWQKDTEKEPDLKIDHSTLLSTSSSPRITGKITNNSTKSISLLELDVFVLDSKENVVAASRSFVDNFAKGSTQDFVFTWPKPYNLGVEACAFPLDVVLSLDKSGSMKSESVNPPEPFNTVLATAENFVKNFTPSDQVGVVSFGDNSKTESQLSLDKNTGVRSISNISLGTTSEQTNINAGLTESYNELLSSRSMNNSKKVIILLTDGIPTEPKQNGVPDFPLISAQKIADEIKSKGIEIYTIGLGKNINEGFLKSISTDDSHFFNAPSKEILSSIYNTIGSGLCPKKPNVITIMYRVLE